MSAAILENQVLNSRDVKVERHNCDVTVERMLSVANWKKALSFSFISCLASFLALTISVSLLAFHLVINE
ncbi:Nonribosomal peptide synthase inpA [Trichinella pseudospiralis]